MSDQPMWWHMYAGVVPAAGNAYCSIVAGPSEKGPEHASQVSFAGEYTKLAYVTSFDHEPSEQEKEAHTPERYRDE